LGKVRDFWSEVGLNEPFTAFHRDMDTLFLRMR
jgi:hypothetical protein